MPFPPATPPPTTAFLARLSRPLVHTVYSSRRSEYSSVLIFSGTLFCLPYLPALLEPRLIRKHTPSLLPRFSRFLFFDLCAPAFSLLPVTRFRFNRPLSDLLILSIYQFSLPPVAPFFRWYSSFVLASSLLSLCSFSGVTLGTGDVKLLHSFSSFPYIYFASLYLADPFSSFSLSLSFDSNDCPQQICTLLTRIYDTSFCAHLSHSLVPSLFFSFFFCCFNTCRIYFASRHECPLTPCRENIAFLSCSHSLFLLSKLIR